ncbi:hypothetical protein A8C75_00960 [Marinobacterium aestuarii]|uniref:Glycosyl transferase family 1 domain-containing protein n=1 Tax=Marinobacterium aestuarii TaxID=1821621 RepID=A0A1A9ESK8_9GAMM|nr:glycosyltransferase family 4 protein [Marinobacterium aestuarii]ANG61164.1 hypothetical protein A8C75_00960 [Marinobacterium aestuarii]
MKKVLFLFQLPPPVHGASVVNQTIKDSQIFNDNFNAYYFNISPAKEISDLGKLNLEKILSTFSILVRVIFTYIKFRPDLVYLTLSPHGAAFYKDGLIALLIKLMRGRCVFHMHGKGISREAEKSKVKKWLYRLVFRGVDVIHLSPNLFNDIESVRDKKKSIYAVANGVEPIKPEQFKSKDEKITFLYLSNLIRSKGADVLVKATTLIPEGYQEKFQVKIIGKKSDQKYLTEIESIIKKHSHNNIHILGPRYDDDKLKELTSSHVFVLPTRFKNECFPLSILEAMSAGLAVISTNEGAITDIVETEVNGDIIPDCTPNSLAKVMIKYIEDRQYSESCSKKSLEKFNREYTIKIFENNMISTLTALAK